MSGVELASVTSRIRKLTELNPRDLAGKIACVRVDGASPKAAPELTDFKIRSLLPSLEMLASAGARTVLLSHFEHREFPSNQLATQQLFCRQLALHSGVPIRLLDRFSQTGARQAVENLNEGEALLIANLANEPAEKENRPEFARFLAGLCDIYCMEAFSVAHEVTASTVGAPAAARLAVAGVQFERIFEDLTSILSAPERPLVAILGGALSLNRLLLVERIAARADTVLVGGELALAFHKAQGLPVGAASVPDAAAEAAARVLRGTKAKLLAPQDYLTVDARGGGRDISAPLFEEEADSLMPEHLAVDIGSHTQRSWSEYLPPSRTLLWHGPLGICEFAPYSEGTLYLAEEIARRTWRQLHKAVICGESLTCFLLTRGFPPGRVSCFSPAGSSILHYAAGHPLPGVEALRLSALKPETSSVVLLALSGDAEDVRLAEFAGGWFSETSSIHCIYVEPGPDQDRAPDLYTATTEAGWLEERCRIQTIFGRTDAALASFGITPASRSHVHGDPSERLVHRAGEVGADVIVLDPASHSSTRYRQNRVVDASPCQVLILPGTT